MANCCVNCELYRVGLVKAVTGMKRNAVSYLNRLEVVEMCQDTSSVYPSAGASRWYPQSSRQVEEDLKFQ